MTGIVLATGLSMVLKNTIGSVLAPRADLRAVLITVLLLAAMLVYRRLAKKKLSPVWLIILSACLGAGIYAI